MSSTEETPGCLACQRGTDLTPLIPLEYRGARIWICPQHLPLLIHDPARLIGVLPGAENLDPAKDLDPAEPDG